MGKGQWTNHGKPKARYKIKKVGREVEVHVRFGRLVQGTSVGEAEVGGSVARRPSTCNVGDKDQWWILRSESMWGSELET